MLNSAPFRDVAADSGSVTRRRCQTPGTGLGLAGTLTPYRGSGTSEPFGLTLAQQSRPSSRAHQAPFAVAFLHGAHGPGRSPLHRTFLPGVKETVYEWVILHQCDQWANWFSASARALNFRWFFFSVIVVHRGGDMEYGPRSTNSGLSMTPITVADLSANL